MKYIIIHENEKVTDFRLTESNITTENIIVVDNMPEFTPQEGFNGVLKYNVESGLHWDYEEAPVPEEPEYPYGLTDEQVANIEQMYRDKVASEVSGSES